MGVVAVAAPGAPSDPDSRERRKVRRGEKRANIAETSPQKKKIMIPATAPQPFQYHKRAGGVRLAPTESAPSAVWLHSQWVDRGTPSLVPMT